MLENGIAGVLLGEKAERSTACLLENISKKFRIFVKIEKFLENQEKAVEWCES